MANHSNQKSNKHNWQAQPKDEYWSPGGVRAQPCFSEGMLMGYAHPETDKQ